MSVTKERGIKAMMDVIERFKDFAPKQMDGYFELTVPLVIQTCGGLLTLRVIPKEDSYVISYEEDLFYEHNRDARYYFDLFNEYDTDYHYGIELKNDVFCKEYQDEFNVVVAIDEFIRFFARFDDFLMYNAVFGTEHEIDNGEKKLKKSGYLTTEEL